jgi:prepilin-type processing-associated H-X9-DG protein
MRRIGNALLLYAQDYDSCLPQPEKPLGGGRWRTWWDGIQPYLGSGGPAQCPQNPVDGAVNPYYQYPFEVSYALNERFYGRFGPGPFPVDNVELPEATALLVEAGRIRTHGPLSHKSSRQAMTWYWDVAWFPNGYPSPHNGRMNVACADGHVANLKVQTYTAVQHDALYGLLGDGVYNWNGGRPNGRAFEAPRE